MPDDLQESMLEPVDHSVKGCGPGEDLGNGEVNINLELINRKAHRING